MNSLFTCSILLMGLLSSTDWLRLRPDVEAPQKQKKCLTQTYCPGKSKTVHSNARKFYATSCQCVNEKGRQGDQLSEERPWEPTVLGLLYSTGVQEINAVASSPEVNRG